MISNSFYSIYITQKNPHNLLETRVVQKQTSEQEL